LLEYLTSHGLQVPFVRFFERLGHGLVQQVRGAEYLREIQRLGQQLKDNEQLLTVTRADFALEQIRNEELRCRSSELEGQNRELQRQLAHSQAQHLEMAGQIEVLQRQKLHLEIQSQEFLRSSSWKITAPLRFVSMQLRRGRGAVWSSMVRPLRFVYRRMPLSTAQRARCRSWFYRHSPERFLEFPVAVTDSSRNFLNECRQRAMHSAPGRILLIERSVPRPDQDAGSVMIFNFIRIWRQIGYAVNFYPIDQSYDLQYTSALEQLGVGCLHPPEVPYLEFYLARHGSEYDIIFTCRPDHSECLLPLFRRYAPQASLLYETHDLHFVREQRQAEVQNNSKLLEQAAVRKEQELRIARGADCTIVVSEQERETLLREDPTLSVEVIPVINDVVGRGKGYSDRSDLLFIGGYDHQPNIDAVLYFIEKVFPLVVRAIPEIRFHIVGSNPPEKLLKLANESIVVHGFVADISPLLSSMRISVNPLRFGAGVKGKIITSMAHGLPCVGTGIAFEGMLAVSGEQVLIADQPNELAQEILRLYNDEVLWNRLAENGLAFVRDRFSLAVAEATFVRLFGELRRTDAKGKLALERFTTIERYRNAPRGRELAHRRSLENALAIQPPPIKNNGYCFACQQPVVFETDMAYAFCDSDGHLRPN
jgi:glycosyltransferase involved in cell wall biosynthesis